MIRFLPVVDVWLGTEGHRRAEGGCRQQSEGKLELNLYVSHIASSLSADIHKIDAHSKQRQKSFIKIDAHSKQRQKCVC